MSFETEILAAIRNHFFEDRQIKSMTLNLLSSYHSELICVKFSWKMIFINGRLRFTRVVLLYLVFEPSFQQHGIRSLWRLYRNVKLATDWMRNFYCYSNMLDEIDRAISNSNIYSTFMSKPSLHKGPFRSPKGFSEKLNNGPGRDFESSILH